MSEQLGSGEASSSEVFSALDVLQGVFQARQIAEARAVELTLQATEVRSEAQEQLVDRWTEVKAAIQGAAETGELSGKDLLLAIIDFRDVTPKKDLPQRSQVPGLGRPRELSYPAFNREEILSKVDLIKAREPILVDDKVGIIQSEATVSILDNFSALGAWVHVEVAFEPDKKTEIKKSIGSGLSDLVIGQSSIQEVVNNLRYENQPTAHGKRNNLDRLKKIQTQVSTLEGLDFDLTHLDEQIARGEQSQAFIRQHRAHRSRLQRALDPQGY